jgi:hypothetical protein
LLRLDPIGVPPYSARGITQSLDPIDGPSQLARTVNGHARRPERHQLSANTSRRSPAPTMDQPALDGVWPGMVLTVDCVIELSY